MSVPKAIVKAIKFTAQVQEHDTSVKIKNVMRWLKMGHEVRVHIAGTADRQKGMESIYRQLEKDVKSGANFMQKIVKPKSISVVLKPTEDAANLQIKDETKTDDAVDLIAKEEDIFSSDFEKKLLDSIKEEKAKNKKR